MKKTKDRKLVRYKKKRTRKNVRVRTKRTNKRLRKEIKRYIRPIIPQKSVSIVNKLEIDANLKKVKKEKHVKETEEEPELEEEVEEVLPYKSNSSWLYGPPPQTDYVDYDKIFAHLGKFGGRSMYEGFEGYDDKEKPQLNKAKEGILLDHQVMDDGAKYLKYFLPGDFMGSWSLVPPAGIDSKDWELFKLWSKIDYIMFNLKMQTC